MRVVPHGAPPILLQPATALQLPEGWWWLFTFGIHPILQGFPEVNTLSGEDIDRPRVVDIGGWGLITVTFSLHPYLGGAIP